MEIPSKYNPQETEDKWYAYWMKHKFFTSKPDNRPKYSIAIPPPNVTGVLHMGHMLNNTIQDVLVRRARMLGFNACWVPGTDHASIATEAKVVSKLKAEGIDKNSLTREKFLEHAWEWKEKHGGIILEQLKKLGASCDWDRTAFTMDKNLSDSVIKVFVDLHNKGLIYRGVRMVNWDPSAQTAVSDEEVIYKEEQSKLYYVRYKIEGTKDEWLTIATTRPETILGDTAICINPKDERYTHLHGKKAIVPMINRIVPIILDTYVEMEFGTGCLKVTPAHDINDYELGIKHNLESIDIFNDNGTLNEKAQLFVGIDRFEAKKLAIKKLEEDGNLVKIEDNPNKIGYSERTDAVIEPKLSMQWFLKMEELSKPALNAVLDGDIKIYPEKFVNTYRHWMENVRDWCISRQLWWGHRIPAYYINDSHEFVIAETEEKALELAKLKTGNKNLTFTNLKQDGDVLDTWFSSWLWPISVFNGIMEPENEDIKYYYPTNDLVTAPEILFFWVARMIIAGYEYQDAKPFSNVYLTGIVRDEKRRKMSKQLGNSPDPIELMKEYSADGVRVGMLLCSPAGNDILYSNDLPLQGRNFANKIWNAFRLVKGWEIADNIPQPKNSEIAINWFGSVLNKTLETVDKMFAEFRLNEALMTVYKLVWDEFASWYLESIKPVYLQPIDKKTLDSTIEFFDKLLKIVHPFMPFITEEIWQYLGERKDGESIMITEMPKCESYNNELIANFEIVKEVIAGVRKIRQDKGIANKETVKLKIKIGQEGYNEYFNAIIFKSCNLSDIEIITEKQETSISFRVKDTEYFVPMTDNVNIEEEIEKLQKELDYNQLFLKNVIKKLSNEKFVANAAPQVVDLERKKQSDAEIKIKALEEQINNLKM
jgi:valyl-tRNA synthetase